MSEGPESFEWYRPSDDPRTKEMEKELREVVRKMHELCSGVQTLEMQESRIEGGTDDSSGEIVLQLVVRYRRKDETAGMPGAADA